jgi:hypothetical protein
MNQDMEQATLYYILIVSFYDHLRLKFKLPFGKVKDFKTAGFKRGDIISLYFGENDSKRNHYALCLGGNEIIHLSSNSGPQLGSSYAVRKVDVRSEIRTEFEYLLSESNFKHANSVIEEVNGRVQSVLESSFSQAEKSVEKLIEKSSSFDVKVLDQPGLSDMDKAKLIISGFKLNDILKEELTETSISLNEINEKVGSLESVKIPEKSYETVLDTDLLLDARTRLAIYPNIPENDTAFVEWVLSGDSVYSNLSTVDDIISSHSIELPEGSRKDVVIIRGFIDGINTTKKPH